MQKQCKQNTVIFLILFVLSSIILPSCRTMGLRQTADTLPVKTKESIFFLGAGFLQTFSSGLTINTGFQYRQGIKKKVEFQFNLSGNLFLIFPHRVIQPAVFLYTDFGAKLQILQYKNTYFSIIPYGGIFGGWSPYARLSYGYLGLTTGFKLLASQNFKKKSLTALYWGLTTQIKENFMGFYYISPSLQHNYPASIPFFDFDFVLTIGLAQNFLTKKSVDVRLYHELGVGISFQTSFIYYPIDYSVDEFKILNPLFTIVYSFSVGKRKKLNIKK